MHCAVRDKTESTVFEYELSDPAAALSLVIYQSRQHVLPRLLTVLYWHRAATYNVQVVSDVELGSCSEDTCGSEACSLDPVATNLLASPLRYDCLQEHQVSQLIEPTAVPTDL